MAGKLRSLVVTLRVGSSSVNQPTSAILGASSQYAIVNRNTIRIATRLCLHNITTDYRASADGGRVRVLNQTDTSTVLARP